jgi:hypothetical protein
MVKVNTGQENLDTTPDYVNITRNPSPYPFAGVGPCGKVFTDNGYMGPSPNATQFNWSMSAKPFSYEFRHGDVYDVAVESTGSKDAQDLTVEMVFVLKGKQYDQYCPQGQPSVQLTISGLGMGETWQGLDDGVHTICPSRYNTFDNQYDYRNEYWADRGSYYGPMANDFLRFAAINWVGYTAQSRVALSWKKGTGVYFTESIPTTGTVTGFIKDRLFVTFVLAGVTFTIDRGGGPWQFPMLPPP